MKRTYSLLLFAAFVPVVDKSQTEWVTKKLDEKLAVKFPTEPQKICMDGNDTYSVRDKDSVAYSASMLDFKTIANLDAVALAPMKDTQQFADQMVRGIATQRQNYTFGSLTMGKWKTFTTYSTSGNENTNKGTLFIHMILIGSKMYNFACSVPHEILTKKNEMFFGSIELL